MMNSSRVEISLRKQQKVHCQFLEQSYWQGFPTFKP